MNLITNETILFLEEDGFFQINFNGLTKNGRQATGVFAKKLSKHITICVSPISVYMRVSSISHSDSICNYYFDGITDYETVKLLVNSIQINPEKLVECYRFMLVDFLNSREKYESSIGIWHSSEFALNRKINEFIDAGQIAISFDSNNKLYSDDFGFAMYRKMPF